ncbi:MAG: Rne/Rng family ribonuclease [Micrococcales bacterium]|nr:Rne/Rng family ribonuclease [Micrococcales bacterium]
MGLAVSPATAEEGDGPEASAASSFSVLFQPPEPPAAAETRSTRRRTEPVEDADGREASGAGGDTDARTAAGADDRASDAADAGAAGPSSDDSKDDEPSTRRSRRRRGGKGRRGRAAAETDAGDHESPVKASGERSGDSDDTERSGTPASDDAKSAKHEDGDGGSDDEAGPSRRRRRRRRGGSSESGGEASGTSGSSGSGRSRASRAQSDEPTAVRGSTRLEAKKQRRREGREAGRRRTIITEAEFLARRESVERVMVVRNKEGRTQMGVLEDGVLVEHYIDQATNVSMAGNIYLGRIQNVLPSMEAAFVDIGKGRNAVLYAGEVNWDAAGLDANQPRRIEQALSAGQPVLVQVTKDPIGHKGARLTSQISLPGRYLVYIPNAQMTGISRKLPEGERARLKKILREVVPSGGGVIVRTAAEGASEDDIRADVGRLTATWEDIEARAEAASKAKAGKSKGKKQNGGTGSSASGSAPMLLHGEPDLTVRVIRDVFNEDFKELVVSGEQAWQEIYPYITTVAPDLADRVTKWTGTEDLFTHHRVDEQIAKAMDRKVWLPSGGSLVIDRTEAMTVVDVNTGKFIGSGGNLEETVTKNNIEAAEELVRQLRLRDIGGIIVVDFIDMVLESNRELVVRRLLECLGRDRTKHQVAEVTSLGLVQMTRKRVGSGLIEVFSETCEHCNGRGFVIHTDPVDQGGEGQSGTSSAVRGRRGRRGGGSSGSDGPGDTSASASGQAGPARVPSGPTAAQIAATAHAAAMKTAAAAAAAAHSGMATAAAPPEGGAPQAATKDASPAPTSATDDAALGSTAAPEGERSEGAPHVAVADAPEGEADDTAGTPAELESERPDAADIAAPEPAFTRAEHPRPRRRRGRVVAPAGPPRHVATPTASPGQTGTGSS